MAWSAADRGTNSDVLHKGLRIVVEALERGASHFTGGLPRLCLRQGSLVRPAAAESSVRMPHGRRYTTQVVCESKCSRLAGTIDSSSGRSS